MEALLKNKNLFEEESSIISPDLALYEVANGIWKREILVKDVRQGSRYISLLSELVESGSIVLIHPDSQIMKRSYGIAAKERVSFYDAVFLALALEIGVELRSLDKRMIDVFKKNR